MKKNLVKDSKKYPKIFYKYINSKQNSEMGINTLKNNKEIITTDKDCIVNMLNHQFSSVFTTLERNSSSEISKYYTKNVIEQDLDEILSILDLTILLKDLDQNKAMGNDCVSPKILKDCAIPLYTRIYQLVKKSIQIGQLPDAWKQANVTPIYKGGSKLEPGNYRPVSLTSIPCKITEAFLVENINKHMYQNHLFSNRQHGFMRGRSCTGNLLEAQDAVTTWLNEGYNVDVIYTDFSKAFDRVSHVKLLCKKS